MYERYGGGGRVEGLACTDWVWEARIEGPKRMDWDESSLLYGLRFRI